MKLKGIAFTHAINFRLRSDGRVEWKLTKKGEAMKNAPGVYIVLVGSRPVYVGTYRNGVKKRWVKGEKRKRDLWHFKKERVVENLKRRKPVTVFAQNESDIKAALHCSKNVFVNAVGIEAGLLSLRDFDWNKRGRRQK